MQTHLITGWKYNMRVDLLRFNRVYREQNKRNEPIDIEYA